ncbi:MAG: DUF1028 domain-containing protein [Actinomycetota bacterium]|nr:DUF1028 domain-containing protein [Actinomycetota bacterium]
MAKPATYSIVACDRERGEWGVGVESKFLAVGSLVSWAEPEVGAIATQSFVNPRYGPDGLALLREGASAEETVERLTSADEGRDDRQVGVVDARGGSASFTGPGCFEWAGGRTGSGYAAQGNILVSHATVDALADTFAATPGRPLAERLLAALVAGQEAGGDRRGQQSAALLVVRKDGGYGGLSDVLVDLRVDDHETPIAELERLYDLHTLYFGQTPKEEWIPVDDELGREIHERLERLGHDTTDVQAAFREWVATDNLEDRVEEGSDRIDPVVLAELRKSG